MSVKFKKLAIASAVGATLGMAGVAQAETALLFPFVTTSASAFTFITLFQDPDRNQNAPIGGTTPIQGSFPAGAPPHAAYTHNMYYGYKEAGQSATDACKHLDFPVQVTQGALLQFEVGNKYDLPSDFGEVAYGNQLRAGNNRLPAGAEGFLIVEDGNGLAADVPDSRRHGEAIVIDTASGLALSYTAIPGGTNAANPDFSTAITSPEYVTSWFPRSLVTTTWYAIPLDVRTQMTPNNPGGIFATIYPVTNPANAGAFGRQENYTSGSRVNNLRCFGHFGLDDLLDRPFAEGGWMSIAAIRQADGDFALPPNYAAADGGNSGTQAFALWKLQVSGELGIGVSTLNAAEPRL